MTRSEQQFRQFAEAFPQLANSLPQQVWLDVARWFNAEASGKEQSKIEDSLRHAETTVQRALEESRQARTQVIEASRRKDEFFANMSHELRTPLNAIIGIGHILAKTAPLTDKQLTCIQTLQTSSESLLMLINDLLDLAKLDSENIKLENVPFELHELVDEVTDMLRVNANEKKISLMLDYDKKLDGKYIGDPHRLKQILTNLASNALKFTERGGVSITVKQQREAGELVHVSIHVADTGIGIPADKVQNIFNKFAQAESWTSRKYGGTGLGLAISKTLAELMGGDITVTSCEGVGSEFILHMPLARDVSRQRFSRIFSSKENAAEKSIATANGLRLLIVEDYRPNLVVATAYMEMLGYQYDTAANGEEAIVKTRSGSYDAILMDVQMPGMDGLTATRVIREWEKQNGLKSVPIIGLTAYALKGDKEKCFEAGMNDYLSKPFSPELFQEKLANLVQAKAVAA